MVRRRRVFVPTRADSDGVPQSQLAESAQVDATGEASPGPGRHFVPGHKVSKLTELLAIEGLTTQLAERLVFIQDRLNASDRLVDALYSHPWDPIAVVPLEHDVDDADAGLAKLKGIPPSDLGPGRVCLYDLGGLSDANSLCLSIARLHLAGTRVWIRGFVRDLHPRILSLFHAMFLFDMAADEYEIVRSIMPIPDETVRRLKMRTDVDSMPEYMLFFVNERRFDTAPYLIDNPVLLC